MVNRNFLIFFSQLTLKLFQLALKAKLDLIWRFLSCKKWTTFIRICFDAYSRLGISFISPTGVRNKKVTCPPIICFVKKLKLRGGGNFVNLITQDFLGLLDFLFRNACREDFQKLRVKGGGVSGHKLKENTDIGFTRE